ncbi:hypothetical protein CYMTET_48739 [Cymbomonas tetramitiformis]|uniref:Uncharacterized protein n=1 Tax=Cymbomonas tetramitiformis TaxID=36881 RepID=A0AAE0BRM1_9CHLO|nr:hypothetical protein CYMTET_48739 [Cymbomonas tetramitiformis]
MVSLIHQGGAESASTGLPHSGLIWGSWEAWVAQASLEAETAVREKAEGALRSTEWQLQQCTSAQTSLQEQLQQTAKEAREAISARDVALQEMERAASTHEASTAEGGREEDVPLEEATARGAHGHAEEDGVIEEVNIDEFGGSVEGARSEEVVKAEQKPVHSAEYKRQHARDGGVMKREDHEASEEKEEVEEEDEEQEQEEGEDEDEDDEPTDKKHASNISRPRVEEIREQEEEDEEEQEPGKMQDENEEDASGNVA